MLSASSWEFSGGDASYDILRQPCTPFRGVKRFKREDGTAVSSIPDPSLTPVYFIMDGSSPSPRENIHDVPRALENSSRVLQPLCSSDLSGSATAEGPSPLTSARMPDHSSKVIVPRRIEEYYRQDTMDTLVPSTPTPLSKQTTLIDFDPQPTANSLLGERFAWRIASGYFAYFLCGYGDGGRFTFIGPDFALTSRVSDGYYSSL